MSKQAYVKAVETRLTALEKAGWSLPLYREMILRRSEGELLIPKNLRPLGVGDYSFCNSSSRTFSSSSSSRLFVQ
jgi:hypothetical protein